MKYSVLIVDDEPLGAARIRRLLQSDEDLEPVEVAESGEAALELLRETAHDILFLDIEMPGISGFDLLEKLRPGKLPYVIFVTAYEEHAVHAFEVQAGDYLLKPVTQQRLAGAVQRAKDAMRQRAGRAQYATRLVIREADGVHLLKAAEIDWIEADRRYIILHSGRNTYALREGIGSIAARLDPSSFVRIHKSCIVNVDRIAKLQPLFRGEYRVHLQDGTELLLTRHYKKGLHALLGDRSL
jgi:two-component system LytT family response regulator